MTRRTLYARTIFWVIIGLCNMKSAWDIATGWDYPLGMLWVAVAVLSGYCFHLASNPRRNPHMFERSFWTRRLP